mgnify:CR=1 FL=1
MITSVIEHPSVLESFRYFEKLGVTVTHLPVTEEGMFDPTVFRNALRKETVLVSLMNVNNEIGTLQPLAEIGKVILKFRKEHQTPFPYFHTDASQGILFIEVDVEKLHVDLLSLDAQKIYGPQGVGALFVRRDVSITPLYHGGSQEKGLRPGTQNVAGVVGFGEAFALALKERESETVRLRKLQEVFVAELKHTIPEARLNGPLENRLPSNVNFSIPGKDSAFLVLQLDAKGVAAATRSACIRGGNESYVVKALSNEKERASSSLRFSFGLYTTEEDVKRAVNILANIVKNG